MKKNQGTLLERLSTPKLSNSIQTSRQGSAVKIKGPHKEIVQEMSAGKPMRVDLQEYGPSGRTMVARVSDISGKVSAEKHYYTRGNQRCYFPMSTKNKESGLSSPIQKSERQPLTNMQAVHVQPCLDGYDQESHKSPYSSQFTLNNFSKPTLGQYQQALGSKPFSAQIRKCKKIEEGDSSFESDNCNFQEYQLEEKLSCSLSPQKLKNPLSKRKQVNMLNNRKIKPSKSVRSLSKRHSQEARLSSKRVSQQSTVLAQGPKFKMPKADGSGASHQPIAFSKKNSFSNIWEAADYEIQRLKSRYEQRKYFNEKTQLSQRRLSKEQQNQCFDRLSKDANSRKQKSQLREEDESKSINQSSNRGTGNDCAPVIKETFKVRKMSVKDAEKKYKELMAKQEQTQLKVKRQEEEKKLRELKEELDVLSFRRQNKLKTQMTEDEKQQFIQRHVNDQMRRQVRQRSNEVEKERRLQQQLQTFFQPNINSKSRKSLNASKISRAGQTLREGGTTEHSPENQLDLCNNTQTVYERLTKESLRRQGHYSSKHTEGSITLGSNEKSKQNLSPQKQKQSEKISILDKVLAQKVGKVSKELEKVVQQIGHRDRQEMSKRCQVNGDQPEKLRLSKLDKRKMSEDSGELQSEREYQVIQLKNCMEQSYQTLNNVTNGDDRQQQLSVDLSQQKTVENSRENDYQFKNDCLNIKSPKKEAVQHHQKKSSVNQDLQTYLQTRTARIPAQLSARKQKTPVLTKASDKSANRR